VAPVRTVIFDFDGTLADTLSVGLAACNAVAPQFGLRTITPDQVPGLMQLSTRAALRSLGVPLAALPHLVHRVRDQMQSRCAEVQLFAGVREALFDLRAAGLVLGVLTSNSRTNVAACLARHEVADWFAFVHSSIHLFGKHRALRSLLRRTRLPAENVVYVGDQDRDVVAGHRSGVRVVAVTWGYQARAQLEALVPDFLAEGPADLVRCLAPTPIPSQAPD
jgi:phosphoglycolate phosphatase